MNDDKKISILQGALKSRRLVVVLGTGVSLALTDATEKALSWKGLIRMHTSIP